MKKFIAALLLLIVHLCGNAQTSKTDPVDVQGWYGAGLKLDLPKKWTAAFDYQARFINSLKTYNGSYLSFGGAKKVAKFLELEAEYRLALVNKGTYHRFSGGGEFSKKIQKTELALRLLLQNQLQDFDDATKANDNSGYWRVRLGAKYPLAKGFDIYASLEPIMKFGGRYFVDNWRNTIGFKCRIAKGTKLDLYYIYRPDYAKSYNRTFHIAGLNIDYTIKTKKKKK